MSKAAFRMPSSIFARTSSLAPFTGYSMEMDWIRESVCPSASGVICSSE